MPTLPKALFLDFDGTLVDSEWLHWETWNQTVAPLGVQIGWEDYERRMVGVSDLNAAREFLSDAGREVTAEAAGQLVAGKRERYRARFAEELDIDEPVRKWIEQNSKNLSIAVVSSSARPDVEPLLHKTGVFNSLRAVVCGDQVTERKPDPEIYRLAVRLVGDGNPGLEPGDCLAVEDSNSGVEAARRAGIRVVRVASPQELLGALGDAIRA